MTKKKCVCCGKVKNISEFYENKQNRDNHMNTCKECHKEKTKKYIPKLDTNSTWLKASVPKGLYTMFKITLKERNEDINTVVQSFVKEYVKNSLTENI